ncbi:MAG: DMT family transporter [Rhodospirillaceae bacterium]|jgi:drug/metabolite transporter (DMT)-like permease|nr:DMT family transporter [Rhodospirillaceae bacterium]
MGVPAGETDKHAPVAGMLWMCAATVFFSISFTLVKGLQDDGLTVYQAVLFRQTLGMVIFMPMIVRGRLAPLRTTVPVRHFYRAALGFLGMTTGYYSLSLINVADSVALQFTLPIFTMFSAILILGEKIYSHRLIATLVGFAGVLIIVRPGFAEVNYGILFALSASAFHAVADTYSRYLARYDRLQTIMVLNFVFTIPLAAIPAAIYWAPVSLEIWPQLSGFCVAGICAQYCLTRSFGIAEASLVSPILFFRLPLVAVIAFYAFNQQTEIWTWVGAGVIILATTWMARIEVRKSNE